MVDTAGIYEYIRVYINKHSTVQGMKNGALSSNINRNPTAYMNRYNRKINVNAHYNVDIVIVCQR